jgi:hypothetical protein
LQVQVKHGATGFSEHNRVYIYLTNKSDDLTFNLQLKTQNGVWRWMATKESPFLLPFGKKFPMFSFPAASCLAHCDPSRSLHVKTRMEFFYYITLTKKPSESPDHLGELPSASDSDSTSADEKDDMWSSIQNEGDSISRPDNLTAVDDEDQVNRGTEGKNLIDGELIS